MATKVTAIALDAGPRDAVIAVLKQLLGERLSTASAVREQHGRDESYHPSAPPDAVVFAAPTEEVAEIVRVCARHKVPVIAVRRRHVARGPCRGAARRRVHRLWPHEPGARRSMPRTSTAACRPA